MSSHARLDYGHVRVYGDRQAGIRAAPSPHGGGGTGGHGHGHGRGRGRAAGGAPPGQLVSALATLSAGHGVVGQGVPKVSYTATVLADSPLAFWQAQETAGNLADSSGNGNATTGTNGAPTYHQPGAPGLGFQMVYPGLTNNNLAVFLTSQSNFTLEGTFQLQSVTANGQAILYNGNGGANGWGIVANTNGSLAMLCGGVILGNSTATLLAIGTTKWYLVQLVKRAVGTAAELWINGTQDSTPGPTNTPNVPTGSMTLGAGASVQVGLSYAAIYNTALSSAQISSHYTAWLG